MGRPFRLEHVSPKRVPELGQRHALQQSDRAGTVNQIKRCTLWSSSIKSGQKLLRIFLYIEQASP
jgi:hypothetical protein